MDGRPARTIWQIVAMTIVVLVTTTTLQASALRTKLQPPPEGYQQIIELDDGSVLVGRVIEADTSVVRFHTEHGEARIQLDRVVAIRNVPLPSFKKGVYWYSNPNRTRLYFAPTARMLKRGEGYFCDYYLFFPGVAVGVTDFFTIGGGMSLLPVDNLADQMFYITPKVGISTGEHFSIAAGALVVGIPDWMESEDPSTIGIVYGVGTAGNLDYSFSLGVGYGFEDGDMADKPAVMFGGEVRLGRRASFVSENWIMPGVDNVLVSYGIRFFGEKIAVDLALVNVLGTEAVIPGVPYVDFVWNF
jgi:hypothetical protein